MTKKPKMRLVGYDLCKTVNGRKTIVETLAPREGGLPNVINFHGVFIDLHDTKGLASIARGRGCKLVPKYKKT